MGSFLNKMVPDWVLAILLFIILVFTALRTYKNGMKKWKKEHQEIELRESLARSGSGMEMDELTGPLTECTPELQALLDEDRHFPVFKVVLIFVVFAGVIGLNVAKGSKAAGFTPFDIECGSLMFWVLSLGVIPFCLLFWYIIRAIIIAQYHARIEAGWEFLEGDVEWNSERTVHYPLVAILSGLVAGMFGIGGGLINGPLMVELGFIPDVAAATGATMLLFTSVTSTTMYVLFDLLNYEYAGPLMMLGFVSTIIGQQVFNRVMQALKRDSLIIFIIAFIVFASAILMGIEGAFVFVAFLQGEGAPVTGVCEAVPLTKELSIDPLMHGRRFGSILDSTFGVYF